MSAPDDTNYPYLPWDSLSPREQVAWAAFLALQGVPSLEHCKAADLLVLELRTLNLDSIRWTEPEYAASRARVVLTRKEFDGWYRVQHRICHPSRSERLTDFDCAEALDRNMWGRARNSIDRLAFRRLAGLPALRHISPCPTTSLRAKSEPKLPSTATMMGASSRCLAQT